MPSEDMMLDRLLVAVGIIALSVVFGSMAMRLNEVCYRVGSNQVVCNDTNKVYKLEEVQ